MPVTEPANQTSVPLQLVQQALPVSSPDVLLKCLIEAWSQACPSVVCHISLLISNRLHSALLNPADHQAPRILSEKSATSVSWTATLASEVLASSLNDESRDLTAITVVPFHSEGRSVGGVLLLDDIKDTRDLTTLAEVSAQLICQLRDVSTVDPLKNPDWELRLRDLKLEAMAEFAAGAGHEINNPVATIAGRSALLLKSETDPERRRILEMIGGQAYRIRDMIGDAMTYARPPEPIPETFKPAPDILHITQNLQRQFHHRPVHFETWIDESITIEADREQFRVVVSCLVRNSLEAVSDGGTIRVELSESASPSTQGSPQSGQRIRFAVSDNGVGLSDSEREHLFDPFYSGRQAGRGLGFGLSKCWQILRLHGGTIDAQEGSPAADEATGQPGLTIVTLWPT